jgi:hypothetical protein
MSSPKRYPKGTQKHVTCTRKSPSKSKKSPSKYKKSPKAKKSPKKSDEPKDYFKKDAEISPKHKKYCRCLLHVQAKGKVDKPYAICRASVGPTGQRDCLKYMNPKAMTPDDKRAYYELLG